MATTIAVRPGEEFDKERVELYLRSHLQGLPLEALQVEEFSEGHSNLTYLLTCGPWQGVLRRPPLGPVAPKAHDMKREFQVLQAVRPHVAAAPQPLLYCDNLDVLGAPFYVMEFVNGVVVDTQWPASFLDTADARRQASMAMVDTLAAIHSVNPDSPQIAAIGRGTGYMQRQVEGWIRRHQMAQTDEEMPEVETIGRWLLHHVPKDSATALIHNDFKLNNVVFAPGHPDRIVGVVDWEMATVGDPLSDLAITLSYWAEPNDLPALSRGLGEVTAQPGFMTRDELIHRYAIVTGRDVTQMKFYLTFAYFKAAGICRQIYYRWWRGQTGDERFEKLGLLAKGLLQVAMIHTQ